MRKKWCVLHLYELSSIKSHKSSWLWCWFQWVSLVAAAAARTNVNPKHQRNKEKKVYSLGDQKGHIFNLFIYFNMHRHIQLYKQWRHLGEDISPHLALSPTQFWTTEMPLDRRVFVVFSKYWVKSRITFTDNISLNSSQNGSTDIPNPRLL